LAFSASIVPVVMYWKVPSAAGVVGFMQPPPIGIVDISLFCSAWIDVRWASSFAFSLLPSVDCKPEISPLMVSRMLLRRASNADAEVPVGSAAPNTVLNADSGEPIVGRLPPLAPP
jgi:hypothetical protein